MKAINHLKNFIKECPLFLLLIVSGLLLTLAGAAGKNSIYKDYPYRALTTPLLSLVMEGIGDGLFPLDMTEYRELSRTQRHSAELSQGASDESKALEKGETVSGEAVSQEQTARAEEAAAQGSIQGTTLDPAKEGFPKAGVSSEEERDGEALISKKLPPFTESGSGAIIIPPPDQAASTPGGLPGNGGLPLAEGGLSETEGAAGTDKGISGSSTGNVSGNSAGNVSGNSAGAVTESGAEGSRDRITQEPPSGASEGTDSGTYDFRTVTEAYFDDAVFIGDSRTQGLLEYGGLEERADFFSRISLTIYNVFTARFVKDEETGKKITVEEALMKKQYGKVYLMLGINELGTGTTKSFMEEYKKVVARLRELQPDAILFVEGIMRVTGTKNEEDPIFNNTNINEKNNEIAKLADGKDIFYIDVNDAVCDEKGNLNSEYTVDDVHLKAQYYSIWKEFLLKHGIVR